jgi:hypothetical protein
MVALEIQYPSLGCLPQCFRKNLHSHPIEEKIDPQGEMDGVFETCHLAGYEKTKTPPSIGCKVQRFPVALQLDSLPSGIQVGEGNWR